MSIKKLRSAGAALAVSLLVATGAAGQTNQTNDGERAAKAERTTVHVVNDNTLDITVYGVRNGYVRRLGTVTALSTARLTLPQTLLLPAGELRLVARRIGARGTYASEPLLVWPGDVIEWNLRNNINLSFAAVHRPRASDG